MAAHCCFAPNTRRRYVSYAVASYCWRMALSFHGRLADSRGNKLQHSVRHGIMALRRRPRAVAPGVLSPSSGKGHLGGSRRAGLNQTRLTRCHLHRDQVPAVSGRRRIVDLRRGACRAGQRRDSLCPVCVAATRIYPLVNEHLTRPESPRDSAVVVIADAQNHGLRLGRRERHRWCSGGSTLGH